MAGDRQVFGHHFMIQRVGTRYLSAEYHSGDLPHPFQDVCFKSAQQWQVSGECLWREIA